MNVTFLDAIKLFYANYTNFEGRATRAEYWYATLYTVIGYILLACFGKVGMILYCLFGLANLIPSISIAIRRMHDIGKSGWWILVSLIPLIGSIWFIILAATPTKSIDYRFKA